MSRHFQQNTKHEKNKHEHKHPKTTLFFSQPMVSTDLRQFLLGTLAQRQPDSHQPWRPLQHQRPLTRIQRKMWCFQRSGRELILESWKPKYGFICFSKKQRKKQTKKETTKTQRSLVFCSKGWFFNLETVFDTFLGGVLNWSHVELKPSNMRFVFSSPIFGHGGSWSTHHFGNLG